MKIILTILALLIPVTACAEDPSMGYVMEKKKSTLGEISYPQLSGAAHPENTKKINEEIAADAATWVCDPAGEDETREIYYNAESKVHTLTDDVFSFTTKVDYDCGGAYPDYYTLTYLYDLKTGKRLGVKDIIKPIITPRILPSIVTRYHKFATEECRMEPEPWDFKVYLDDKTLVFIPDLPHGMRICEEEIKMTLRVMKEYLQPGTVINP